MQGIIKVYLKNIIMLGIIIVFCLSFNLEVRADDETCTVTITTERGRFGKTQNDKDIKTIQYSVVKGSTFTLGNYGDYINVFGPNSVLSDSSDSPVWSSSDVCLDFIDQVEGYYLDGYRIKGEDDTLYHDGDTIEINSDITFEVVCKRGIIVTYSAGEKGWHGYTTAHEKIKKIITLYKENEEIRVGDFWMNEVGYILDDDSVCDSFDSGYAFPRRYDGYINSGWTVKNGDGTVYEYGDKLFTTDDVTLEAEWERGYLIECDANGGKFLHSNGFDPAIYDNDTKINYSVESGDCCYIEDYSMVKKDGYALLGWKEKGTNPEKLINYEFYPDRDMELEAVWGEASVITFDLDGGSAYIRDEEGTYIEGVSDITSEYKIEIPKTDAEYCKIYPIMYFSDPFKEGYVFKGWKSSVDDSDDPITYDYTEYGEGKDNYIDTAGVGFSYDINNKLSFYDYQYKNNSEMIFLGWSDTVDGKPIDYDITLEGDITLYAVWGKSKEVSENPTPIPSSTQTPIPTSRPTSQTTPTVTPTVVPTTKPSSQPTAQVTQTTAPSKTVTPTVAPSPAVEKGKVTTFSIKNKAKVKKTAKIKIKDKDKIKKITLNGKSIKIKKNKTSITIKLKSYKKALKKKGKWNTLKVTDKRGNVKSIKFKTK